MYKYIRRIYYRLSSMDSVQGFLWGDGEEVWDLLSKGSGGGGGRLLQCVSTRVASCIINRAIKVVCGCHFGNFLILHAKNHVC